MPARLLFILPVLILDGGFYWWTFSALTTTLSQLGARAQSSSAKLQLYRRFSYVLFASALISAGWLLVQMATIASDSLDGRWASLWIFDAFWHVLYYCLLLATCVLWKPSASNHLQYAYMEELVGAVDSLVEEEPVSEAPTAAPPRRDAAP